MTIVYIVYDYDDYGSKNFFATTDKTAVKEGLMDFQGRYDELESFVDGYFSKYAEQAQTLIDNLSEEELLKGVELNLDHGGPNLIAIRLFNRAL